VSEIVLIVLLGTLLKFMGLLDTIWMSGVLN